MKLTGVNNNFWAKQASYEDFILQAETEKNIGNPKNYSSNLKERMRINTTIPKKSRKDSEHSENSKPLDLFQPISSNDLSELKTKEQELFSYHLEGNNLPEFLPRPNLFINKTKAIDKIKKNETTRNNFFEILNIQSNDRIPIDNLVRNGEPSKKTSTDKPLITSMNNISNIRPNTADVDYKVTFQRGHRMFTKGMKIYGPPKNEEKKENIIANRPPMKRAGTSNLLFRRTSKTKKPDVVNQNEEFINTTTANKGLQMNLFEKYQNFLDEKRKKLDKKFEELRDVIRNTKNMTKNKEETSISNNITNKAELPEFFRKHIEPSKTFSTNFFAKKKLIKKNEQPENEDLTNSPKNEKETESKMSAVVTTAKKKVMTIGNYEIGPVIGKGSYAIVKLGIDRNSSEKVAIKTYEKYKLFDPQKKKNVQREISILQKTNHPNIIHLIKIIESPRTINLVMEFISNTSMHGFIKTFESRRIPEKDVRFIFKQIVEGINYLHSNNFIHRDIKLENILIDKKNKQIKIIDFGFSVCVQSDKKLCMFCGTPSYMAPEIVSKQDYNGKFVDIWALGILLYTMLCGKFPFKAAEDKELYKKINTGFFDIPTYVPYGAEKLIKNILKVRPSERMTTLEILNDSWIKEKS